MSQFMNKSTLLPFSFIPLCLAFGWQKKETYLYQQHTLCFPEAVHKSWGTAIKMVCKYLGWVFKLHAGFLAAWFPSILTASLLLHRIGTPCQMCPQSLPANTSAHGVIFQSRMLLCSATVLMPPFRTRRQTIWLLQDLAKALSCALPSPTSLPHAEWYFASIIVQLISAKLLLHMSENSSFITFHVNIIMLEIAGLLAPRSDEEHTPLHPKCFLKNVIK